MLTTSLNWAQVLAELSGDELRVAMLALADDLENDEGARALRELASASILGQPVYYPFKPHFGWGWISDEWNRAEAHLWAYPAVVPRPLYKALRGEVKGLCKFYPSRQQAWADMLRVLGDRGSQAA